MHVAVNGRPTTEETIIGDAVELNKVNRKLFFL
jgi:hypothetical protein